MKQQTLVALSLILFIALFAGAATVYNSQKSNALTSAAQDKNQYLRRDDSPSTGPAEARVTIVEFFDPACETCKSFHPFVKKLMADNHGKVNLVLRYLPLHPGSDEVIKILEAARLQNLFWETLDTTFRTQSSWAINHHADASKLLMRLGSVGLDMTRLRQDMQRPEIAERIQRDMADAQQLQVSKTPGFFVNGKPLLRFGYQQLQDLVESEVANN